MNKQFSSTGLFNKKIAVISDIHSNVVALNSVKSELYKLNVDCIIILGDLLTYGCHPQEVIDTLKNFKHDFPIYFVKGNHDQFYFNYRSGVPISSYEIPGYIEDSINWTLKNINEDLSTAFNWYESIKIGSLYLSHANPYEYGDWGYLNNDEECKSAAEVLKNNGYKIGVFGHTHRHKSIYVKNNIIQEGVKDSSFEYDSINDEVLILNSGSIGQPRGNGASFLIFDLTDKIINYHLIEIDPDLDEHISAIKSSSLPENTKVKLISFFGEVE